MAKAPGDWLIDKICNEVLTDLNDIIKDARKEYPIDAFPQMDEDYLRSTIVGSSFLICYKILIEKLNISDAGVKRMLIFILNNFNAEIVEIIRDRAANDKANQESEG